MADNKILTKVISQAKEALAQLKEVDACLTEIERTSGRLSKEERARLGSDAFTVAEKYGKQAADYLAAVNTASRAGYDNAEGIARLSLAIQNSGSISQKAADQYLFAMDRAYRLGSSLTELTGIFDGINQISNDHTVDMAALADGMSIAGSTASDFGVEANEAAAALGAMIETTRQSGADAAHAFQALLLCLRQVTDAQEGIDSDSLARFDLACRSLNVSLKETKNGVASLRDPMAVLKELSAAYTRLGEGDTRKTDLLSSVGGRENAVFFDALLSQWDTYESMLDSYAGGTGSMAQEAEITAESWEGSLNRLGSSWTQFISTLADQDAVTGTIDLLSGLLDGISGVTEQIGTLPALGALLGLGLSTKNTGMHT